MNNPRSSFEYEDLLSCARGELFGAGNPQLPLPPMLMFDRISHISGDGGAANRGGVVAELALKPDDWFFQCHFKGDPIMPGCLGVDAMWQLLGFFLGWMGGKGRGRALGVDEVRFTGMIVPSIRKIEYHIDLTRVMMRRAVLGIANGLLLADGNPVYEAKGLRVGLFADAPDTANAAPAANGANPAPATPNGA